MDRWIGKTAVVTGASAGIGAAICVALADAGINVVGLDITAGRVDEHKSAVSGQGSITSRKCNVSSSEEVAATFKWIHENFVGVHIMINNAGVFYSGEITDIGNDMLGEEDVLAVIDTNLKGTVLCARHAIASMNSNNFDGHVININSIAGHYIPVSSKFNVYPSTKYAITGFTGVLLNELSAHKKKIKVTSLSPGLVRTEMSSESELTHLPALLPKDVADAVLYVLSTPPTVNIEELTITPVAEVKL